MTPERESPAMQYSRRLALSADVRLLERFAAVVTARGMSREALLRELLSHAIERGCPPTLDSLAKPPASGTPAYRHVNVRVLHWMLLEANSLAARCKRSRARLMRDLMAEAVRKHEAQAP